MIHNYPRIIRKKIMRTFEFSNELVSIQLNLRFFIAHTRLPGDVSQQISDKRILSRHEDIGILI